MHLLFLNDASDSSNTVEEELMGRGFHVTSVQQLEALGQEWQLGVHDLILLDQSVSISDRLALLKTSGEWHRPIPIMMIFETGTENEA